MSFFIVQSFLEMKWRGDAEIDYGLHYKSQVPMSRESLRVGLTGGVAPDFSGMQHLRRNCLLRMLIERLAT